MKVIPVVLFATIVCVSNSLAQETAPDTLFGYLKAEMPIGYKRIDGTASVSLHSFSNGTVSAMRSLSESGKQRVDAVEFEKAYPSARTRIKSLKKKDLAQSLTLYVAADNEMSIGRITTVGSDYLIIEFDDSEKRRLVPKHSIAYIDLESEPWNYVWVNHESEDGG